MKQWKIVFLLGVQNKCRIQSFVVDKIYRLTLILKIPTTLTLTVFQCFCLRFCSKKKLLGSCLINFNIVAGKKQRRLFYNITIFNFIRLIKSSLSDDDEQKVEIKFKEPNLPYARELMSKSLKQGWGVRVLGQGFKFLS